MKLMAAVAGVIIALHTNDVFACTTSTDPETVVQAQVDAYNKHDVEQFASCYAEDVKLQNLTEAEPLVVGKKALIDNYQFLKRAPKEFRVIIDKRIVNGPIVIDYERITGMGEGQRDQVVFAIYEVRAGKIKTVWFPPAK